MCSHKVGLKQIVRYLKFNMTKGLAMKLQHLKLDLFADADFSRCFAVEDNQDRGIIRF